jgi:hypothetical protein
MPSTKILKNPPQSASDELGHVCRHGVSETKEAYQKMRCLEEFGPNYDDESDECNNAQEWGSHNTNGHYTSR